MQLATGAVVNRIIRIRLLYEVLNCRLPVLFMQERRCIFILQGMDFEQTPNAELSNLENDNLFQAASLLEWNKFRVDSCKCSQA
jgi:hypothetical protein